MFIDLAGLVIGQRDEIVKEFVDNFR